MLCPPDPGVPLGSDWALNHHSRSQRPEEASDVLVYVSISRSERGNTEEASWRLEGVDIGSRVGRLSTWKKKKTLPGSECRLLSRCCRLRAGQARPPCSRCACNDTTRKTCSLVHRSTPIPQERGQLSCTRRVSLHEQLNQPATHPRVDDRLDLIVGSVRQVGQCPAGVRQHVRVAAEQQSGQHAEAGGHLRQDTVGRRE